VGRGVGSFEQAHGGTLLLDEIGEMPIGTQAKLLRVLEDHNVRRLGGRQDVPVDVRVIAATNRNPSRAIESKSLREDLYYRLNVFEIKLPPLRERKEDIPAISEALIRSSNQKNHCRVTELHPEVLNQLTQHNWPGNVRELRNVIERSTILAGEGPILPQHLPLVLNANSVKRDPPKETEANSIQIMAGTPMSAVEEAYVRFTLKQTGNNKVQAARILNVSVRTLHSWLAEWPKEPAANTAPATESESSS
jgi:transcriptional regulator with PAS, ATPase and Fis domain